MSKVFILAKKIKESFKYQILKVGYNWKWISLALNVIYIFSIFFWMWGGWESITNSIIDSNDIKNTVSDNKQVDNIKNIISNNPRRLTIEYKIENDRDTHSVNVDTLISALALMFFLYIAVTTFPNFPAD